MGKKYKKFISRANLIFYLLVVLFFYGCGPVQVPLTSQINEKGNNFSGITQKGDVIMRDKIIIEQQKSKETKDEDLEVKLYISKERISTGSKDYFEKIVYYVINKGLIDVVLDDVDLYCGEELIGTDKNRTRLKPGDKNRNVRSHFEYYDEKKKDWLRTEWRKCNKLLKLKVKTTRGNEFFCLLEKLRKKVPIEEWIRQSSTKVPAWVTDPEWTRKHPNEYLIVSKPSETEASAIKSAQEIFINKYNKLIAPCGTFQIQLRNKKYKAYLLFDSTYKQSSPVSRKKEIFKTEAIEPFTLITNLSNENNALLEKYNLSNKWLEGSKYYLNSKYRNAIRNYKEIIENIPTFLPAFVNLGICYGKINRSYMQLITYQKANKFNLNNAYLHFLLGSLYLNYELVNKAIFEFEKSIQLDPDSYYVYRRLADAYMQLYSPTLKNKQDIYKAINYAKKAIEINNKDIWNYVYLGNVYLSSEDFDKAIDSYNIALNKKPQNTYILSQLKKAYLKCNYFNSASKIESKLAELEETDRSYRYICSVYYDSIYTFGADSKARQLIIDFVVQANPKIKDEYLKDNYSKDKLGKIVYDALTIENLDSKIWGDYASYGFIACRLFWYKKAAEFFEKAIEVMPAEENGIFSLGEFFISENCYGLYSPIKITTSTTSTLHTWLAKVYHELDSSDKAIIHARNDLEIRKDEIHPYINLAEYYRSSGEEENAIDILDKALALFPKNLDLQIRLAKLKFEVRNYRDAIIYFEKVDYIMRKNFNEYNYKNNNILLDLGDCYKRIKSYDKAIKAYKLYIKTGDNTAQEGHLKIGDIYEILGKYNISIKYYKEACNNVDENNSMQFRILPHYKLGLVYKKNKKYNKALNELHVLTNSFDDLFIYSPLNMEENIYENLFNEIGEIYLIKKEWLKAITAFTISKIFNPPDNEIKEKIRIISKMQAKKYYTEIP